MPRRPAPTAKPRARAPAPPTVKREVPSVPATSDESQPKPDVSASDPVTAMAANLKAAVGDSPKPSPKLGRKPPPARSLPQPPKKSLPQPPKRKDHAEEEAPANSGAHDTAEASAGTKPATSPTGKTSYLTYLCY